MGLGPPELSLSLGWAGEALPNPRDTRPGSLPTLPSPERIWAALKQKKKRGKGHPWEAPARCRCHKPSR